MNVLEALEARRSIRVYKPTPVAPEVIKSIIEAANRTPSWANTQPWEVYVVSGTPLENLRKRYLESFRKGIEPNFDIPAPKSWPAAHDERINQLGAGRFATLGIERDDKEARRKVTEMNFNFFGAPHVIFLCMDRDLSHWSLFDLGSFSMSLMLAAQHHGLSTIPAVMLVAYPDIIREEIDIPQNLSIVFGLALGYGDLDSIHNQYRTPRRNVDEFLKMVGM
ncbi:MAG: nitroreductase [Clostridia bacterium]|nr:nitroreductase [Clostridia bacterium]